MNPVIATPRARILIVDDSPTNVSILLDALEGEYEVSFANSGPEALALIAEAERPDLILLDVMMPEMDGYQVCEKLKADPTTHDIPIIFVTAMDSSESESAGLALGAEDYLTKPINLGIARLRIRNLLERRHLHQELELALASARQGLWTWDFATDTVYLDPRWAEPLGYRPYELAEAARPWAALVHPEDLPALKAACHAHLQEGSNAIAVELRMRNKDDAFMWVQILGRTQPGAHRATGTFTDISQRKRDESIIAKQRTQMETLIASIPDLVISLDTAGNLQQLHCPEGLGMLPQREDWLGEHHRTVLPESLSEALDDAIIASFSDPQLQTREGVVTAPDGVRHFSITVNRLKDSIDWPTGFIAVIRDITETRRTEAELKQLAFHDPLTGLPNRRLLLDRVAQSQRLSLRNSTHAALMMLDLDRFKALNDLYGHEAGDLLLIEVGRRLRSCIREHDTVARLGGDEFVILLENLGKTAEEADQDAARIAEKISGALAEPFLIGTHVHTTRASIGRCLFQGTQIPVNQLLDNADQAMYQVKQIHRQNKD